MQTLDMYNKRIQMREEHEVERGNKGREMFVDEKCFFSFRVEIQTAKSADLGMRLVRKFFKVGSTSREMNS